MDAIRFDRLTRVFTDPSSRRGLLRGLAGVALGVAATRVPATLDARKKHKTKRQKPKLNDYGCLDAGQKCGGNSDACCSGICQGKKPKQGKRDRSTCVAHNVGSCTADQDVCTEVGSASCGSAAHCYRTTGKAGFCGGMVGNCAVCRKDTECDALGYGPGAACVFCTNGCPDTGQTACIGPGD